MDITSEGLRRTAFVEEDLIKEADQFSAALPNDRVTPTGTNLTFLPNFTGSSLSGAAYGIYAFKVEGYDRNGEVRTQWAALPQDGTLWIGLSNWNRDCWNWFTPAPGSTRVFAEDFDRFFDADGDLLAVVLLVGDSAAELDLLRLGSLPPTAAISVIGRDAALQLVPLSFQAGGSTDPDGTIVSYEWDFDGDGEFDEITESPDVNHAYEDFGTFNATVRAVDDSGLGATASTPVEIHQGWMRTLGTSGGDEIKDVAISADGSIWACGDLDPQDGPRSMLLVKYSAAGELLLQKTFAVSNVGSDFTVGTAIANDSEGGVFIMGKFLQAGGARGTLVRRRTAGGDSLWTIVIADDVLNNFTAIATEGNSVYMTGTTVQGDRVAFFASVDGSGTLLSAAKSQVGIEFHDLAPYSFSLLSSMQFAGTIDFGGNTDVLFASMDSGGLSVEGWTWGTAEGNERATSIERDGGGGLFPEWAIAFNQSSGDGTFAGVLKHNETAAQSRQNLQFTAGSDLARSPDFGLALLITTVSGRPGFILTSSDLEHRAFYGHTQENFLAGRACAFLGDSIVLAGGAPLPGGLFDQGLGGAIANHDNPWIPVEFSLEAVSPTVTDISDLPNIASDLVLVQNTGAGGRDAMLSLHAVPQT